MTGKEELFLGLVRPHWRQLHAVARQYGKSAPDAEDLVQEALLRAWRNFEPTREGSYRPGWLFVILRNVAKEWRRSAAAKLRIRSMAEVELTELLASDPGEVFATLPAMTEKEFREFLDDQVAAAFDALPEPHREVLVLSVAGGLAYREIAEVLECPMGTVMSRISRARRMLREALSRTAGTVKPVPQEGQP